MNECTSTPRLSLRDLFYGKLNLTFLPSRRQNKGIEWTGTTVVRLKMAYMTGCFPSIAHFITCDSYLTSMDRVTQSALFKLFVFRCRLSTNEPVIECSVTQLATGI